MRWVLTILTVCLLASTAGGEGWQRISNGHVVVVFDGGTRTWEAADEYGESFLTGLSCSVSIRGAEYSTSVEGRIPEVVVGPFQDAIGRGEEIVLTWVLLDGALEVTQHLKVHRGSPRVVVETEIHNLSARPLAVDGVAPIITTSPGFFPRGPADGWALLLETLDLEATPSLRQVEGAVQAQGFWAGVLWHPVLGRGATVGFLHPARGIGQIMVERERGALAFRLAMQGTTPGLVLGPDRTFAASSVSLRATRDILGALRNEAVFLHPPRTSWSATDPEKPPSSTWIARHRPGRPLDLKTLQAELDRLAALAPCGVNRVLFDSAFAVDSGSAPPKYGDWLETGATSGVPLDRLVSLVKSRGFSPGLRLSPFLIEERSRAFSSVKDVLVLDATGEPLRVDAGKAWSGLPHSPSPPLATSPLYSLDVTSSAARFWLQEVFRRLRKDLRFEHFVLDDLTLGMIPGRRSDQGLPSTLAADRGLELIREASDAVILAGDASFLAAQGGHTNETSIGPEVTPDPRWIPELLRLFARRFALAGAGTNVHLSSLHLGEGLDLQQARSLATIHALLGGTVRLADPLTSLEDERIDVVRKILPPLPAAAIPLDLFTSEVPNVFRLSLKDPEPRDLVFLFNPRDRADIVKVSLAELGIPAGDDRLGFEFWTESFLGCLREELAVPLAPYGCAVVNLLPARPAVPRLLSTSRHLGQGAVEIPRSFFDPEGRTLWVTAELEKRRTERLYVHVPPGFHPRPELLRREPGVAVTETRPDGLVVLEVTPTGSEPVVLRLRFAENDARENLATGPADGSSDGSVFTRRGPPRPQAPAAIRSAVLFVGESTDPLALALESRGIDFQALSPELGAAARALVHSFLLDSAAESISVSAGDVGTSTEASHRTLVLGEDSLSHTGLSLFAEEDLRTSLLAFLERGGTVVFLPQLSGSAASLGRRAGRGAPSWLAERIGAPVAPSLEGLFRPRGDVIPDLTLAPPDGSPSRFLEAALGPMDTEASARFLACPALPVRAFGLGVVERDGLSMARLVLAPWGASRGLVAFSTEGLETEIARLVMHRSSTVARRELAETLDRTREQWIATERQSSLLPLVRLEPLGAGQLDPLDPKSCAEFQHEIPNVIEVVHDRLTVRGCPVTEGGVVYSGVERLRIDRSALGDRDLVIASIVNPRRKETGVSVSVDGRRLFDHRYGNFSVARASGWSLQFLHVQSAELGRKATVSIELQPLGKLTGSAYRYGLFRGPDPEAIHLSDLAPLSVTPPGSGVALDRNANGGLLFLGEGIHFKGIGTQAGTTVQYAIPADAVTFHATLGVDIEAPERSRLRLLVRRDGVVVHDTGPVDRSTSLVEIAIPVHNASTLELVAEDGGGLLPGELADWADARFTR